MLLLLLLKISGGGFRKRGTPSFCAVWIPFWGFLFQVKDTRANCQNPVSSLEVGRAILGSGSQPSYNPKTLPRFVVVVFAHPLSFMYVLIRELIILDIS